MLNTYIAYLSVIRIFFYYLKSCVQYTYITIEYRRGHTHLLSIPRDAITKRLLSSRARIFLGFEDCPTASTIGTGYSSWNQDRPKAFCREPDERVVAVTVVVVYRSFANVDCPPRRTLIRDSFGAFHRDTFVWGSLCDLRGTLRDPRQFAPKAVSNFTSLFASMKCPARPRSYPKSVSSRRIEGATQRQSDLHRLLGKVDLSFSSFENERHPTAVVDTVLSKQECYFLHKASFDCDIQGPKNKYRWFKIHCYVEEETDCICSDNINILI